MSSTAALALWAAESLPLPTSCCGRGSTGWSGARVALDRKGAATDADFVAGIAAYPIAMQTADANAPTSATAVAM